MSLGSSLFLVMRNGANAALNTTKHRNLSCGVRVNRAGLTNVGALFGKMCGAPLLLYTVESRIESKMVHPFNMDKRPTTVLFNDNVCQLKIKDRKIQAVIKA